MRLEGKVAFISGGAYFLNADTDLRLDDGTSRGTTIDLEDLLNVEEDTTEFFVKGMWRFTPKHRIEAEYFQSDRDGTAVLTEPIRIDGTVVGAGSGTDSSFDVKIGRLSYGYSFINDGQKEVGINVGLHIADTKFNFSALGIINGIPDSYRLSEQSLTLPLPNVGLYGTHAFSEKLAVTGRVGAFAMKIGDYDGVLVESGVDLVYSFNESVGLIAGLSTFYLDVEEDDGDFQGEFDYFLWGPRIGAYYSF